MTMKPTADTNPWHRLWSARLMILTTAYSTAAGAWAVLPPDWKPDLSEAAKAILAAVGVLLPTIAAASHRAEQMRLRASGPDDTDQAGA
jgi:hypothetical protein